MNILESIRSRAAKLHKTVVLPEGDEERNQQAAAIMASLDMAPRNVCNRFQQQY